jgi:hypothetical protein
LTAYQRSYDVPDLGLTDATLPEIITAIYERYVVGQQVADRDGGHVDPET